MMNGHGLNLYKPRTRFGKWMDNNELSQQDMMDLTGLNKNTISSLCNDKSCEPHETTKLKIIGMLKREGYAVTVEDLW